MKNKKYRFIVDKKVVLVSLNERRAILKARKENFSLTLKEQKLINRVSQRSNLPSTSKVKLVKNNNLIVATSSLVGIKPISIREQKQLIKDIITSRKVNVESLSYNERKAFISSVAKELTEEIVGGHKIQKLVEEMNQYENTSGEEIRDLEELDLNAGEYETLYRAIKEKASAGFKKNAQESKYYQLLKVAKKVVGKYL